MSPYPSLVSLRGLSCTRMSALGNLGKMAYKTRFWDRVWKQKEKMKVLRMEVVKGPFFANQIVLQSVTCIHAFITNKMK